MNTMRNDHFRFTLRSDETLGRFRRPPVVGEQVMTQVTPSGGTRTLTFGPEVDLAPGVAAPVTLKPRRAARPGQPAQRQQYWYSNLVCITPGRWQVDGSFRDEDPD
jgi:hypothetical protein